MNDDFSRIFRELMESEIIDFGVASMFWEESYGKHVRELAFYCREFLQTLFLNLTTLMAFVYSIQYFVECGI